MFIFVLAVHILACLILIGSILLQPGKGGDPASAFGGGMASTMFGPRGPTNVLSQATTVIAILFMFTSITLALYSNKSIMAGSDVGTELERLQRQKAEKAKGGVEIAPSGNGADTDAKP
jgi:preprotein translocase subunit SecG